MSPSGAVWYPCHVCASKRFATAGLIFLILVSGSWAEDLILHGAVYTVRTDVGIGDFVEADSFVLVYAYRDQETQDRISAWLREYSVFDIRWRNDLEQNFGVELVDTTPVIGNSASPQWNLEIGLPASARLLLLFVDEDIQFNDPFGYVFLEARRYMKEEVWILGVSSLEDERIGKITLTIQ